MGYGNFSGEKIEDINKMIEMKSFYDVKNSRYMTTYIVEILNATYNPINYRKLKIYREIFGKIEEQN